LLRGSSRSPGIAAFAFAVALAIEFVDELADGTKGAALPLIRADLGLSYAQIGLLISVPLLVGSLIELPLGLVAGQGRARHRLVLAGGVVVAGSLAAVAAAHSVTVLMIALVAFFPASGAFVSLTQAALMDAAPGRHQQRMAAWNLAGSAGAVGGPLLLAGVLAAGGVVGPVAVGFIAQQAGLTWALAALSVAPAAVLAILPWGAAPRFRRVKR
jgi:FSR family fosmidomycin resistance protein-like MFS transporter